MISALSFVIFYGQFFIWTHHDVLLFFLLLSGFIHQEWLIWPPERAFASTYSFFRNLSSACTNISLNISKENLNSLMNQNNDFKFFNIFSPSSSSNLLMQTFASCLRKPIASQNNGSLFVQFKTTEILSIFSKLFLDYFQSLNEVRNPKTRLLIKPNY